MKKEIQIRKIHLNIYDVKRMKDFYSNVLRLVLRYEDETVLHYGFNDGTTAFLELHIKETPISGETATGLYHFALLLKTREELASILYHLAISKYTIVGAADHIVSEALYLKDPEGNDIEIYCDRPADSWTWKNGFVQMDTLPLKAEELIAIAKPWHGFPKTTTIGHLHFYGNDMAKADKFFKEIMNFELVAQLSQKAHFYAINKYHHHVGLNTWKGTELPLRIKEMLGFFEWDIAVDEAYYSEIKKNLEKNDYSYEAVNGILIIQDIIGTVLKIEIKKGEK